MSNRIRRKHQIGKAAGTNTRPDGVVSRSYCPHCVTVLSIQSRFLNQKAACPVCGGILYVSGEGDIAPVRYESSRAEKN